MQDMPRSDSVSKMLQKDDINVYLIRVPFGSNWDFASNTYNLSRSTSIIQSVVSESALVIIKGGKHEELDKIESSSIKKLSSLPSLLFLTHHYDPKSECGYG